MGFVFDGNPTQFVSNCPSIGKNNLEVLSVESFFETSSSKVIPGTGTNGLFPGFGCGVSPSFLGFGCGFGSGISV